MENFVLESNRHGTGIINKIPLKHGFYHTPSDNCSNVPQRIDQECIFSYSPKIAYQCRRISLTSDKVSTFMSGGICLIIIKLQVADHNNIPKFHDPKKPGSILDWVEC
jgi:hypothetical protein